MTLAIAELLLLAESAAAQYGRPGYAPPGYGPPGYGPGSGYYGPCPPTRGALRGAAAGAAGGAIISGLLGATDDDRASAAMFFIGYRAALARTRALSVNQVEAIEETALASCAATSTMTTNKAFAEALAAEMR
jgi:hypothetical protein